MTLLALSRPSAADVLPVLIDAAIKGAVVLAAAGLLVALLRRAPAAARHLVWCLALLALVVLPVLSAVLPGWQVPFHLPLPPSNQTTVVFGEELAPPPGPKAELPESAETLPRPRSAIPPPPLPMLPLPPRPIPVPRPSAGADGPFAPQTAIRPAPPVRTIAWPVWVWLAGVLLALLPVAGGYVSLDWLRTHSRPIVTGPLADLLRQLCAECGLRRPVELLLSDRRAMPMTWGVWQPVILLPAEAENWPASRLRVVLLHELAHVRRFDCLTQVLGHLARSLHWFNPLAWLALRGLRAEQERACDDQVLRAGTDAPDYAAHLLALASTCRSHLLAAPVALAIGRAKRLERRLIALLDTGRNRRPLPLCRTALALLAALSLLIGVGAMRWQPAAAAPLTGGASAARPGPDRAKLLNEARIKILRNYVERPDEKILTDSAIEGMVKALKDPYSEYLTGERLPRFHNTLQGSITGIGVQIAIKDRRVIVITPLPNSPAYRAGLRPGDTIVALDDVATEGMKLLDVIKRIVGPAGTVVKLKVRHNDGTEAELAITRARFRLESVEGYRRGPNGRWDYLIDPPNKIAYVHLSQFDVLTAAEAADAFEDMKAAGVKGLILDLRFCPGGLLSSAVDVTRMLLDRGIIVTTRGRDRPVHRFEANGTALLDVPILVLVNGSTASAAEIVAGALADNKRATVLGARSFGKGSIQEVIKLNGKDGALKLTIGHYQLPGGRFLQRRPDGKEWGVDPTDGYHLALTPQQDEELVIRASTRALVGGQVVAKAEQVTPDLLAEKYADPQLAAGLKTMIARVRTGSFLRVGRDRAAAVADEKRIEALKRQRDELRKKLATLDKELGDLEKPPRCKVTLPTVDP